MYYKSYTCTKSVLLPLVTVARMCAEFLWRLILAIARSIFVFLYIHIFHFMLFHLFKSQIYFCLSFVFIYFHCFAFHRYFLLSKFVILFRWMALLFFSLDARKNLHSLNRLSLVAFVEKKRKKHLADSFFVQHHFLFFFSYCFNDDSLCAVSAASKISLRIFVCWKRCFFLWMFISYSCFDWMIFSDWKVCALFSSGFEHSQSRREFWVWFTVNGLKRLK